MPPQKAPCRGAKGAYCLYGKIRSFRDDFQGKMGRHGTYY